LSRQRKGLLFTWTRARARTDHGLASLGDSYVNFVYSLALSNRKREPEGTKAKRSILAEARALIVYAWLSDRLTLNECVKALGKTDEPVDGFTCVLVAAKERITLP
jgi:hypothetical protein